MNVICDHGYLFSECQLCLEIEEAIQIAYWEDWEDEQMREEDMWLDWDEAIQREKFGI